MKYTARHIQRFLTTGKIDVTLWKNHFPSLLPTQVPTCEECSEFEERTCAGGRDPVECFLAKGVAEERKENLNRKIGTRCSAWVPKGLKSTVRQNQKTSQRCE